MDPVLKIREGLEFYLVKVSVDITWVVQGGRFKGKVRNSLISFNKQMNITSLKKSFRKVHGEKNVWNAERFNLFSILLSSCTPWRILHTPPRNKSTSFLSYIERQRLGFIMQVKWMSLCVCIFVFVFVYLYLCVCICVLVFVCV